MKISVLILIVIFLFSCNSNQKPSVEELFKVDRNFSALATEKGYNIAFIEFAHPDAILLRENTMPIVGKPSVIKQFEKISSEEIQFSWKPMNGEIAQSGELGFTYGIYTLKIDTMIEKGTYVSVWKKDSDGNWKYVLDSGNKGLGE